MQKMNADWPSAADEFVKLYARAENTLKQSGFLGSGKVAQADWKSFAAMLGADFFAHVQASENAGTLIGHPPKKRMKAGWPAEPPLSIQNVNDLFVRGVCQVRHNLVHGEKFVVDPDDRERGDALVSQSIWVLSQALVWTAAPKS